MSRPPLEAPLEPPHVISPPPDRDPRAEAGLADDRRTERLLRVTGAVSEAVTPEQIYAAVVDHAGEAIGASSAALWVLTDDGQSVRLVRASGAPGLDGAPVGSPRRTPALEVLSDGQARWFAASESAVPQGFACVPLVVQGRVTGALGFSFDGWTSFEHERRSFVMLVARYAGQALEKLALLEAERRARAKAEVLLALAQEVLRAQQVDDLFPATLEALEAAIGARRSAVLLYGAGDVMRFRAWRGLSDGYRQAVEGHSPWPKNAVNPPLVWVADAANDPALAAYRELFAREKIGALGFVPLFAAGRLLGKFMVYFEHPRELTAAEHELLCAIGSHIAAAADRLSALAELKEAVRFSEMFTGVLGHDLRNPLGAIMTAAQLLVKRSDQEKHLKPLSRILSSGGRMARMIDQLLDFTRVRVGQGLPLLARRVDVKPVVEQVIAELDDPSRVSRIELETRGDTVGHYDPDRLAQVFSNLLANALQHGAPGAPVRVTLDGSEPDLLRATVHNAGSMPVERLERMFEPMTGDERRGEKSQGLGLGLFISAQIARAHSGNISVESNPHAGTTFQVALPRVT